VRFEDVTEVVLDGSYRVQRVHPALQHKRESVAPLAAQCLAVQGADVDTVERDRSAIESSGRAQHPSERESESCLATAGFTHQPNEFALLQSDIHVTNRPNPHPTSRFISDADSACLQ
jgi:hypothetical protein